MKSNISNICSNSRLQQNRTDSFTMRQYEIEKCWIFFPSFFVIIIVILSFVLVIFSQQKAFLTEDEGFTF